MKLFIICFCIFLPSVLFAEAIIESIGVLPVTEGYQIHVKGAGNFDYSASTFKNPERVIIDFRDVKTKIKLGTFKPADNDYVSRIRTTEFATKGQKFMRMIIDLKSAFKYKGTATDKGLILQLSAKDLPIVAASPSPVKKAVPKVATPPPTISEPSVVIGPEDLIEITVFELPQFNVSGRVAADGTLTIPLAGSVEIRGLTKKEAEIKIAKALEAKYINNANVSLQIKEYKSKQVSVFGAVLNPGAYYILSNRTLLQILSEAGGTTPEAGNRCFIFRAGSSERFEINLDALLNSGDPKQNIPIYPGDVINIPKETKIVVYVLGEVKAPGAVEMSSSMPVTLLGAIARAGGLTPDASESKIQIRRKDNEGKEALLKANLKDILKGKSPDVLLLPGDVVNVPQSFF